MLLSLLSQATLLFPSHFGSRSRNSKAVDDRDHGSLLVCGLTETTKLLGSSAFYCLVDTIPAYVRPASVSLRQR